MGNKALTDHGCELHCSGAKLGLQVIRWHLSRLHSELVFILEVLGGGGSWGPRNRLSCGQGEGPREVIKLRQILCPQSGNRTVLEGKCDPSCRMAEKGQTLESIHQAWQGLQELQGQR